MMRGNEQNIEQEQQSQSEVGDVKVAKQVFSAGNLYLKAITRSTFEQKVNLVAESASANASK